MSFARQRLFNLTIIDFSSNIGWNDAASTVTIKLAPEDNESISQQAYQIGHPVNFAFGSFKFNGFLERIIESEDTGGKTYEVILSDGKEILRNVEVVTSGYLNIDDNPIDCTVTNLLNVYGAFEYQGYGNSLVDDSGLLIRKFCEGVTILSAQCKIKYRDHEYSIDINNLASILPPYYRVPGNTVNLLEQISSICDDAGYNYYIDRIGYTFYVRLVSLNSGGANQGISNYLNQKSQERDVISYKSGLENASDAISNYVLFGGLQEEAIITTSGTSAFNYPFDRISSFWGYNPVNNQPIKGYNDKLYRLNGYFGSLLINAEFLDLPTLGVEDIFGSTFYRTSTLELQLVMGGKETWELWLEMYNHNLYKQIFATDPRPLDYLINILTGGAGEGNITREFVAKENDVGIIRCGRVYDWLKGIADGFLGKQFLIEYTGNREILAGYDQYDPGKINYNWTPSSTGHFQNNDTGLFYLNRYGDAIARDEDGKILTWAFFYLQDPSYNFVGSSEEVLPLGRYIGIKATLSDKWVIWNGKPHFHITLSQPAFELQDSLLNPRCSPVLGLTEEVGYPALINILFGVAYNTNAGSSIKLRVGPFAIYPAVTITAIKATRNYYGPWYSKYGRGGKTKIEQDPNITPWTYGSRELMNSVSLQRVRDQVTYKENVETGQFTKIGLPSFSLGDELIANGPRLTGISISYGSSGITTTYTVSTYTPRFGFLPKGSIDFVKRLASRNYATNRLILKQYFDSKRAFQSVIRTLMGKGVYTYTVNQTLGKRHDRSTPHAVLLLQSYSPRELYGLNFLPNKTKTIGGFTTIGEAIKDIGPTSNDSSRFNRSVVASIDQIFRPYANATETEKIPKITLPIGDLVQQAGDDNPNPYIPTSISYNPLKINGDIDLVMPDVGDINQWDHHNFPSQYVIDNTILAGKGVAFKGPIMLTGWGTAITGEDAHDLVPNVQKGLPWQDGKDFKTGPIDLVWDEIRGVWTSHDSILCMAKETILGTDNYQPDPDDETAPKFPVGEAYIYLGRQKDPSDATITLANTGSADIPQGSNFIATYDVYNNQWITQGIQKKYRFWEECATDDLIRVEDDVDIYYWDFDIEENVDDPGYGDLDDGYCTESLSKVTVIKTNGYTGTYEITKSTIECPDGSTQPVIDELWFHHGLFKEIIVPETDPCEDHQPTTEPPPTSPPPPTTEPPPPTCLYFDSVANCYLCRRCDTPPDGDNWQPADGGQQFSADACAARASELGTTCITTTLAPGCYLTPVIGSDGGSCYQCIPASSYNPFDPTYDEPGNPMDCDECVGTAEELNTSPECALSVCLYQRQDNPFCYYCGDCGAAGSIGNFTGVDRNEACAQEANRLSASACNVTTTTLGPEICLFFISDPEPGCYICQDCRYGPDGGNNVGTYANADLCNSAIPEGQETCVVTTQQPGCRRITDSETQCEICVPESDSGGNGIFFNTCQQCQESADNINNDVGSPCTVETYCLYPDTSTNGICYYCSICINDPDNPSQGSYTSIEACEVEASSREPASCNTTPPPTTQPPVTTTQNPNCIQVVSSVSCGENGLSVTYTDVARCGVSQVYQTDFQTVILRAEVRSLKRQLSDIYTALEKHGIKINNA